MKKFDFRKLLVLALALVLIFALVACGPTTPPVEEEEEETTQLTAADYFTALWNASKSIGATPIASNSDLNFEIGMDIDLAIKTGTVTTVDYKLGLDVKAIYDRDNTGSDENVGRYSAAMVKITDRNATGESNLLSVYYYMDEPTIIYAKVYDQNVKLQFNADNGDGLSANGQLVTNLTTFLTDKMVSDNTFVNNKSIDDIIMQFANSFGPNFNLDNVVGILMKMLGMDMGDLIETIQKLISFEVADPDKASLLDVLNGLGKVALNTEKGAITKTATSTGFTWSATLKSIVKTLLSGYTDGLINDANTTIGLKFDTNTAGNELQNLIIELDRKKVTSNKSLYAKIAVRELSAVATTATTSAVGNSFGMVKADFKENYKVNLDATISLSDAMLKMTYDDAAAGDESYATIAGLYSENIGSIAALAGQEFAGVLRIEADGMLNLLKNDSATGGYAQVFYKTNEASAVESLVVEASYDNTNGVGIAKIWMDGTNEYAQIARDYLLLNIVKMIHESNEFTAIDPENPTRAELLAGTNGAMIASLIDAINSEATTFYLKGLELQTLLWDLCFVDDVEEIDPYEDKMFEKLPESQYPWALDFLSIAKVALNAASQTGDDAITLSVDGIASTLLGKVTNTSGIMTHFGIFETMFASGNSGTTYASFESQDDIYGWFYKVFDSVVIRMTDAGVVGAIKLVPSTSGKYVRDKNKIDPTAELGELVEYDSAEHSGFTRYNVVKSTVVADAALIGAGTWFYQGSSTLDKTETRKMWTVATNVTDTTVSKIDTSDLTASEREAIYDDCIEKLLVDMLAGSSFIGATPSKADKGQWIANILAGNLDASISFVGADGVSMELTYTDIAGKIASIAINASIEALDSAYVVSAGTNLGFSETEADSVIDFTSYMNQIRADYALQIAG